MNYVEWLRVRNCLRVVAIVLAIFVVLAIILRISINRYMSPEAWIAHMAARNGATHSELVLPDGTKRIIIDDPSDQTHIVMDDHGYAGKHIVITEPTRHAHEEHDNVAIGSVHVVASRHGALTTTVIDTNGSVPFIYYMAFADLMALIVAMVLAAPFAREADGHLEIALTKPVARASYAIGVIGADVVGIIASAALTVLALYICQLMFEPGRLDFSGVNARAIAIGIAAPVAWYAMLCAATTWLRRAYVAVLVSALPVAIVVGLLTLVEPNNAVTVVIHDVAWALSRIDPWTYVQLHAQFDNETGASTFGWRLALEVLFFVVYGALAVWQWQRVEA